MKHELFYNLSLVSQGEERPVSAQPSARLSLCGSKRAQSCPSLPCHQRSWMGPFPVPYPALPLSSALFLNQGCASLWQGGGHLGCAWHLILMAGKAIWAQPRRQLLVLSEVALVPVCQGSAFCLLLHEGSSGSPAGDVHSIVFAALLPTPS